MAAPTSSTTTPERHHAENAIREICSRVVWLERGKIKADGAAVEVLEAYANASGNAPWCV